MTRCSMVQLPSEILGTIGEYVGPVSISHIWCCGDKLLNAKLASPTGLRKWRFLDKHRMYLPWLPTFLGELRGLEEVVLKISRDGSVPLLTVSWLSLLPGTLKKLYLQCREGELAWLEPEERRIWENGGKLTSACKRTNLTYYFPCLVELVLKYDMALSPEREIEWLRYLPNFVLASLPHTLRVLKLPTTSNWRSLSWNSIPIGIEVLSLGVSNLTQAAGYVSRYQSLHTLSFPAAIYLYLPEALLLALPPSLTSLGFGGLVEGVAGSIPNLHLPRQLQHFSAPVLGEMIVKWAKATLPEMPEELVEEEKAPQNEKEENDLKRSKLHLKSLNVFSLGVYACRFLPNTLESLEVDSLINSDAQSIFTALPSQLRSLVWQPSSSHWKMHDWLALPSSLTLLHIECFSGEFTIENQLGVLPPNLTRLIVDQTTDELLAGITHTDVDQWKYKLPPSVRRLTFDETVEMRVSHPDTPLQEWACAYDALRTRSTGLLIRLISEGVLKEQVAFSSDPESDDRYELLEVAIGAHSLECLKILIESGEFQIKPQTWPFTPYFEAASLGAVSCLDYLHKYIRQPSALASFSKAGQSMANIAASHGRTNILQWLQKQNYRFPHSLSSNREKLPVIDAIRQKHWETAAWLVKETHCPPPPIRLIMEAAQNATVRSLTDPFPIFTTLLNSGIDIPSMLMAEPNALLETIEGFRDPIGVLIWLKNQEPDNHTQTTKEYPTSLIGSYSPYQGSHESEFRFSKLIDQETGNSLPHHLASKQHSVYMEQYSTGTMDRYLAMIEWLVVEDLENFYRPNLLNRLSAIHIFATNGQARVFKCFIQHGVIINTPSEKGSTPSDVAQGRAMRQVFEDLRRGVFVEFDELDEDDGIEVEMRDGFPDEPDDVVLEEWEGEDY